MGRIIDRRRVMGGESLPYDAEIEYLDSSGTQWVDTLITESQYIDIEGTYSNLGVQNGFWGVYNGVKYLEHQHDGFFYSDSNIGLLYTLGSTRTLVSVIGNEVYINRIKLGNVVRNPHTTAYTIPLFCLRTTNGTAIWKSKMRLWNFKIWDNNVLVRDYIPVRVGSVGYLYDKVSKQLFGNSGTGAFILGPDKGIVGNPVNINVKTHSTGSSDASLDVITEDGEPYNILYNTVISTPWTNEYIEVIYKQSIYSWQLYTTTPCLYDGQVYQSGDLIATWRYNETKDINIVGNI